MSRPFLRAVVVFGALLLAVSCGDDTTTTSPTTTGDLRNSEIYSGTLNVGDSQFYSFTAISPGTTEVTLISLRPSGSVSSTLKTTVGLGLGVPQGTDCALGWAINTTSALKAQLTAATNISTYCVKVADVGNLTGPVDYTVRALHP